MAALILKILSNPLALHLHPYREGCNATRMGVVRCMQRCCNVKCNADATRSDTLPCVPYQIARLFLAAGFGRLRRAANMLIREGLCNY
jgi:hypothetical protein